MSWKDIEIDHIVSIEKCVGEFEVTAREFFLDLYEGDFLHYGSFKVKIYENQMIQSDSSDNNNIIFTGFTNLRLASSLGGYEGGIGFGRTSEQALENTIQKFVNDLKEYKDEKKTGLSKEDFVLMNYDQF